ncbi:hypothetical protein ACG5V6_04945 [Streptomyces chitinivorans]|uniref:Uncharacterized protein n=1 Tax=Streptomyces chitinivorans TaxID=1257027 RepID=A0ABW7HP70_9ACTN|nr:hypothetical protein [Streptomyces chitinivorans]MDH2408307.1 hypothetical protein [Streptomyces chitinivorans]
MATESNRSKALSNLPKIGSLVVDTATNRVGVVMDRMGSYVQLRPPAGGREWDCLPRHVRPATPAETLSARVSIANAESRLPR